MQVGAMGAADSYSQTLGVIGYSLLPLAIVLTVAPIVYHVAFLTFLMKVRGVLLGVSASSAVLNSSFVTRVRLHSKKHACTSTAFFFPSSPAKTLLSRLLAHTCLGFRLGGMMPQIVGVLWSAQSAGSLLVTEQVQSRKVLIMYPTALLYGYFLSLHSGA
jgi:hypothetical protein